MLEFFFKKREGANTPVRQATEISEQFQVHITILSTEIWMLFDAKCIFLV